MKSAIVLLGLLLLSRLGTSAMCHAQQPPVSPTTPRLEYQQELAKTIRRAAEPLWPSIVTVELIGTNDSRSGEVQQDAPTSGIIVDPAGYVLASGLVTRAPAASILARLSTGQRFAAEVVASDSHRNLVLLKLETDEQLPAVPWGEAEGLAVGQTTIALGRYGSDGERLQSTGILSATDRLEGIAIQTDARISPSFYGGPLIDLSGQILGIVIPAVAAGGAEDETSWYDAGIAFAIPSKVVAKKLPALRRGDDIKKGLIGLVPASNDPYNKDTTLAAVRVRSPAAGAGLEVGDRVTSVAGKSVIRFQQIKEALGPFDAGDEIDIEVIRGDQTIRKSIILAATIPPLEPQRLGIMIEEQAPAPEQAADEDGQASRKLVVRSVVPDSPADGKLRTGDVIKRLGQNHDINASTMRRMILTTEPTKSIEIEFDRADDKAEVVTFTPKSIDGEFRDEYPAEWNQVERALDAWTTQPISLPDAPNQAAIFLPKESAGVKTLGLFIALCPPGEADPEEILDQWKNSAAAAGVVVLVIAAEAERGWLPKEIDVVSRFTAAAIKQAPVAPTAVSVGSLSGVIDGDATAADAMALAVAISEPERFYGLVISAQTRPPAIRMKENDPATPLQVLLPIESDDDLPTWGTSLRRAGYPIVLGGKLDRDALLRWTRLLQAI